MGIAGCALGRVNVCRSGFRSSSWWSAPRRWSSQLTPRTTAAQRTQSASWLSARPNRVTARIVLFCEFGDRAREGTPTSRGRSAARQRRNSVGVKGMKLIVLMFLLVMIAVVSAGVLRRRREHRRAERAKALRYERWKARRDSIPNVSSNLCGSTGATQGTPVSRMSQNRSPISLL